MARDWTRAEVEATVADYLAMLGAELDARPYSKTEHRRRLSRLLENRSDGAIERKHQNISAVLLEFGIPYIDGYKPLRNYQILLFEVVEDRLKHSTSLVASVEKDVQSLVEVPTIQDILEALVQPPVATQRAGPARRAVVSLPAAGLRTNYLQLEARNRALGQAGEEFVLRFEAARLSRAGGDRLAARIERVSETRGDSAGFDILSFNLSGRERLIEVKTTKYGPITPFFVTRNELEVSRLRPRDYHLYRVFDFRRLPRLFLKRGDLSDTFSLDPAQYLARIA